MVDHAIDSGLVGADLLGECGGKVPGRLKDRGCIILCFGQASFYKIGDGGGFSPLGIAANCTGNQGGGFKAEEIA